MLAMTRNQLIIALADLIEHHAGSSDDIRVFSAAIDRNANRYGFGAVINAVQSTGEILAIHKKKRVAFRDAEVKNYTEESAKK
jgi:hypothetical protein